MRRRRRRWIVWAALPVVLLVCDVVYWSYAARQLDTGFSTWVANQRAAGWKVQATRAKIGGWPLAATLTTRQVMLAGGTPYIPGGVRWSADRLVLRISLLHPMVLHIIASGLQHLRVANGPVIQLTGNRLQAEVPLRLDRQSRQLLFKGKQLQAGVPADGQIAHLGIGTLDARVDLHPEAALGQPAIAFAVKADAVTLPADPHWAFGPRIASIVLNGTLNGPLPPATSITADAIAWRNAGGSLRIQRFGLHWGPMDLSGTARLALDQQLQPTGTGSAQVTGYAASLDALTTAGVISHSAALAARAVLSLMARPAADGRPAEVSVPLSLQRRTFSVQRMPLLRLPILDWPAQ